MARRFRHLLGGAAAIAMAAAAPMVAHATPYAFASNQIRGLLLEYSTALNNSKTITPTTGGATQTISTSASFGSFSGSAGGATAPVDTAIPTISSYSGPDTPAPAASFTAVGAGNFTGTRSASNIGVGSAISGGVPVNNVAESYGNALGNATANDQATISFSVVGSGRAITISGSDAINVFASTDLPSISGMIGQSATASITNTFAITASTASSPLATYVPAALNLQIGSINGVPASNSDIGTYAIAFTTPILSNNVVYNISLISSSTNSILPGTPVPEPGSLLLLGTGVLGIGMLGLRRRRL